MKETEKHLKELSGLSGRLEKENYLAAITDEETIKILQQLYNDMKTTGIAYKKLARKVDCDVLADFDTLSELMDYLFINNTGTDKEISVIQNFIKKNPDYKDFIEKIVTKTYKAGVTAKTLNKIFGQDFIPLFEVQLAESYSKHKDKVKNQEIFITNKYDGHRTLVDLETLKIYTRKGHEVHGLSKIEEELFNFIKLELKNIFGTEAVILDGEILIAETNKPKDEWFNETSKILRKDGNKENLKFIIFDIIPSHEFYYSKFSKMNYKQRREILENLFNNVSHLQFVELAPILNQGYNLSEDEIMRVYEELVSQGEEGAMINLNAPYYCKRTSTLLKLKPVLSADLEIVGFQKGEKNTKYENTLGALLVDFEGTTVGVGGLSDSMRDEIWNNQDKYLGKIAEILYTSISKNQKDDSVNLRFPRFKTIREDKTKEDINIER